MDKTDRHTETEKERKRNRQTEAGMYEENWIGRGEESGVGKSEGERVIRGNRKKDYNE